jgi:hypothetical protein
LRGGGGGLRGFEDDLEGFSSLSLGFVHVFVVGGEGISVLG